MLNAPPIRAGRGGSGVKALAAKPRDLSSIPGTHLDRRDQTPTSTHAVTQACTDMHARAHNY